MVDDASFGQVAGPSLGLSVHRPRATIGVSDRGRFGLAEWALRARPPVLAGMPPLRLSAANAASAVSDAGSMSAVITGGAKTAGTHMSSTRHRMIRFRTPLQLRTLRVCFPVPWGLAYDVHVGKWEDQTASTGRCVQIMSESPSRTLSGLRGRHETLMHLRWQPSRDPLPNRVVHPGSTCERNGGALYQSGGETHRG